MTCLDSNIASNIYDPSIDSIEILTFARTISESKKLANQLLSRIQKQGSKQKSKCP